MLRRSDRYDLIETIAKTLQSRMVTTKINMFLSQFNIEHGYVNIVPSKRDYVRSLLEEVEDDTIIQIATELEINLPTNAVIDADDLRKILSARGLKVCEDDFNRALKDVNANPSQAIGNACTTLESICKAIIDAFDEDYPNDESLQSLLKKVLKLMKLSPESHADPEIKRILGGLVNVGAGLATIRTRYSTFHGKGKRQKRLEKRHAKLAINSLATVGLFLLETYIGRYE